MRKMAVKRNVLSSRIVVSLAIWICLLRRAITVAYSPMEDQRVNIGIVCGGGSNSMTSQLINATWWQEFQHPVRTKSGSRVKVNLFFLDKPASVTLSSANEATEVLRQQSISMVIGDDDVIYRLAAIDQQLPYFVVSSGDGQRLNSELSIREEIPDNPSSIPTLPHHLPASDIPVFHLLPRSRTFHRAVSDVIQIRGLESAAVFYDSIRGLELIDLLMAETDVVIWGWRLNSRANETFLRDQLTKVRSHQLHEIVVVSKPEVVERLLNAALRLSMLSLKYSWIFVHPVPMYIDYEPFSYTGVNFTTFNLLTGDNATLTTGQLSTADDHLTYALIHDALHLVKKTLEAMTPTASEPKATCSKSSMSGCFLKDTTLTMEEFLEHLRQSSVDGLSGQVRFDSSGQRASTVLRVLSVTQGGLEKIGDWYENRSTPSKRLQISKFPRSSKVRHLSTRPLQGGVNRVVTVIDPPFVMYKQNHENLTGNDRYEGFLIDLFAAIASRLGFQYEFYESPDGNYGSKDFYGEWNGMIRELIMGNATMCLGAISITSDREEAVDFTKPFKQKMFNFLMKKPEEVSTIFQFLSPLSAHVWLMILSSLFLVSLLLFLMDRFSPNFPVNRNNDHQATQNFGMNESVWFMYGALVGGGTEGWYPRTVSGRLLTSAWWFFGLIIISSYTANLAAFLTITRIESPIKSIADLALQTHIRYGTVRNTYAMSMFKNSQLDILQKMWYNMGELHPEWMVSNTKEGIEKAKEGDYAFIWDAPINKHIAKHDCSVISTGTPFDEKGYGIGMPTGASYRDDITMQILSLGEKGEIVRMETKWWSTGQCDEFSETSTGNNEELHLLNVAGVFLLLAFGGVVALAACFVEFISARLAASRSSQNQENHSREAKECNLKMSPVTDPEELQGL